MKGLIDRMARNGVAANLLMLFLLFTGILSALTLTQKVFPEFTLGRVQITVEYRGASPEEIERSIIQPIEEQVEAVEGIRQITARASEGVGVVTAELNQGVDINQKLDEIKSRVDRITNFPDRAEEPEVRELTNIRRVIEIAIYGRVPERTLKQIAYRVEEELAAKESISLVETSGVRDDEISIEVPRDVLRAYGLSLTEIARRVGANSVDLPSGDIETGEQQILVRVEGQNYDHQDYADIVLIGSTEGAQIRLGDIAEIEDGFRDTGLETYYNGEPAAIVQVFRVGQEQVLTIEEEVKAYLDRLRPTLPAGVRVDLWQNDAEQLRSRLNLLIENALIGAVLVMICLALFLRLQVAFWVGFGIVIAFVGTFAVMKLVGTSINQMSLFGFILAVGIVVDDAIVVGENIHAQREDGVEGLVAAIRGAQRVAVPVVYAVTTTILAFAPLLFVPGTIGKFLSDIPIVVIAVLTLSLVESLLILPHHLSRMKAREESRNRVLGTVYRVKGRFDQGLKRFTNGPLNRALRFATRHYMVVIAGALASLFLTIGLFLGGYVRFVFFPQIRGEFVNAQFEMPVGTTEEVTRRIAERLVEGGRQAARTLVKEQGGQGDSTGALVEGIYVTIGTTPQEGGPEGQGRQFVNPAAAGVRFKLSDPDSRAVTSRQFEEAWREAVGPVPTADYVSFSSSLVDIGSAVSVELSAPDTAALERAVEEVKRELRTMQGVFDIYDTQEDGQQELELALLPQARSFGLFLEDLADQVRAAFFGAEALRIQRGREEVRVYVRLPETERDSIADLSDYRIRGGPRGDLAIPLSEVAELTYATGPSTINRRNGRRIISVNASVQEGVATGQEITGRLRSEVLPRIRDGMPDLDYSFGGEQREQQRTLPALFRNFAITLFAIYALLAVSFRSYVQPLIILAVVPFGMVGAVLGHLLMGLDITFLSLFGIVGLSGVVINDALILLDFVNARRLDGVRMRDAVIDGARSRFRPILLTSVTTFLGVAPIILSQAVQAQFLIPLAVSIAAGILVATLIQMLLVPALTMAQFDAQRWLVSTWSGRDRQKVQVVHNSPGGGGG